MNNSASLKDAGFGKINAIDSLRGYAIVLVLLSHTFSHIPGLIWPIKRVLLMGIYGVQLFFLASALTLMMSWSKGNAPFLSRSRSFLVRRFFRIAPLYYLAIPFYLLVSGLDFSEFNLPALFATMLFYNAWFPNFTFPYNNWVPVPGGWSISVEFAFYLAFPILMIFVRKLTDAICLLTALILLMLFMHYSSVRQDLIIKPDGMSLFAYYSPLNHFFVFALGIVLYWLLKMSSFQNFVANCRVSSDGASLGMIILILLLSFYGQHKFFEFMPFSVPTHFLISFCFMVWAAFLILKPNGRAVNKMVVKIGKVSFGIYLLHFAVLQGLDRLLGFFGWTDKGGVSGVAYFFVLTSTALACSYALALIVYRTVEEPCINFGHRLAARAGSERLTAKVDEPVRGEVG
jgi:peptidoglycan/LPS O-acetylase OafA/YrhL